MGQFKEHPYANTTFLFGGPLVRRLERYLPPPRNDYVHDGLVSDGGLLGSAFGAAGAKVGGRAGGVAGLPGGFLGVGAGAFLGGTLGYFGGAYAGHLGVREAELIGNILNNPSSYDVDQLGNPIGLSAFQDQSATDLKELPQQQGAPGSPAFTQSPVDRAATAGSTPMSPENMNDLLKLRSIIQAVGSRGLFPTQ